MARTCQLDKALACRVSNCWFGSATAFQHSQALPTLCGEEAPPASGGECHETGGRGGARVVRLCEPLGFNIKRSSFTVLQLRRFSSEQDMGRWLGQVPSSMHAPLWTLSGSVSTLPLSSCLAIYKVKEGMDMGD